MELAGRIAVVTGASSGLGRATVQRLAAEGMHVVAVARREDRLRALADAHPRVRYHVADVTDLDSMDRLAAWVGETFGACHALVNNAGVGGGRFGGREDVDDFARTVDVNLLGVVRGMAAFHDLLAASAPSRIVNVASVAGKVGIGPAGYAASKFAVVGLSEAVGLDWAHEGIAVCQLNPGFVRTEGMPQEQILASPLGRLVEDPPVVAEAVVQVLRSGARERTVPRWYRALVVARHVAAPLFWHVAAMLPRARGHREA